MRQHLFSLLIFLSACAAGLSQTAEIEYTNWPGEFGELIRLLESRWMHGSPGPKEELRTLELLEHQGQFAMAMERAQRLTGADEFRSAPWAESLRQKKADLRLKLSASPTRSQLSTAAQTQLRLKLPPSHIEELDLPAIYRQKASEDRLRDCFVPSATREQLAVQYPVLKDYLSLQRFWKSADGKVIGCLIYHGLGPSLLYSTNGGRNWLGPLYVGLHRLPHYDYLMLADSKLPLIAGGRLQIEVTVWCVDNSKPGNDRMGYAYLWKKWHRMLSVPLEALMKDSDSDGLTDLFEERILTDPHSRDTDGDGLADGVDNQPLIPTLRKLSETDQIFLALAAERTRAVARLFTFHPGEPDFTESVQDIYGERLNQIRYWMSFGQLYRPTPFHRKLTKAGLEHYTGVSKTLIPPTDTTFIQSEAPVLSGITGGNRWIVMSQAEMALYRKKFGKDSLLGAASIDPLLIDSGHRYAYLVINQGRSGEAFILEKQHGEWHHRSLWMARYD